MVIPKNNSITGMYEAIGSAISTWTRVETQLYQIFSITLSLTVMQDRGYTLGSTTPNAVLDSIDGFRAKLLMIDAAIRSAIPGHDQESVAIRLAWAEEQIRINELHGKRSNLAHWNVSQHFNQHGPNKVLLIPRIYSSRDDQGVMRTDVEQWEQCFIEASVRLGKITERLLVHRELQRRFVAQVASQIRSILPHDPTLLEFLKHELSDYL